MTERRVELVLPPELVEAIAHQAADLVRAELESPEWLTLDQAAERYQTTAGALRWRAQRGRLPGAVKDEGRWLLNAREFDQALASARIPFSEKWGERRANGPAPGHRRS